MREDRIDISIGSGPPLTQAKMPDWNKFWFIPTSCPHLREFVLSLVWNCFERSILVELRETPAFSAYEWFSKLQVTPENAFPVGFLPSDAALCFFNENDEECARLYFKELKLFGHTCVLSNADNPFDSGKNLVHEVKLGYGAVSMQSPKKRTCRKDYEEFLDEHPTMDTEWEKTFLDKKIVLENCPS